MSNTAFGKKIFEYVILQQTVIDLNDLTMSRSSICNHYRPNWLKNDSVFD